MLDVFLWLSVIIYYLVLELRDDHVTNFKRYACVWHSNDLTCCSQASQLPPPDHVCHDTRKSRMEQNADVGCTQRGGMMFQDPLVACSSDQSIPHVASPRQTARWCSHVFHETLGNWKWQLPLFVTILMWFMKQPSSNSDLHPSPFQTERNGLGTCLGFMMLLNS